MATITFYDSVSNYNPPDAYLTFGDKQAFLNRFPDNGSTRDNRYSYDNRIGRIVSEFMKWTSQISTHPANIRTAKVVRIMDDDEMRVIVGVVDSVVKNSMGTYIVTFTVDEFTSAMASQLCYGERYLPTGGTLLYRRKDTRSGYDNGEMVYLDEGISPRSVERKPISLKDESLQPYALDAFRPAESNLNVIMAYHDNASNTDFWLMCKVYQYAGVWGPRYNPKSLWDTFRRLYALLDFSSDDHTFDPSGVLFYGLLPCSAGIINSLIGVKPTESDPSTYISVLNVGGYSGGFSLGLTWPTKLGIYNILDNGVTRKTSITATDWNSYEIRDAGGNTLYRIPYTSTPIAYLYVTTRMVFDISMPSVMFDVRYMDEDGNDITVPDGYHTFTMPCYPLTFHIDSEAVYIAQDRTYNKQMRSLTALNQLVDGVIGGVNQGAMISAFSRDQTSSVWRAHNGYGGDAMPLSVNKGLIGGGLAIAGAAAGYAYTELYANKEAQRIEDRKARVSADTLLMSLSIPADTLDHGGMYNLSYDQKTRYEIEKYHSLFGYQTNYIESSFNLFDMDGYIQGEYLIRGGDGNRDTLTYIKGMLSYGARFTHYDS